MCLGKDGEKELKENLNIPKTIKVGFQKRDDTYTGQLAYVVYTDVKGVLRKETSWNGWRDKKISPKDFDNVPTSGFVLNKGVGGTRESCGWNPRNEWIRVYDPRGFEFEISVANLLFILQECTSTKGKGLEGEFVYAWDRADLVLLPCDSINYKKAEDFTKRITMSVHKKDVIPGGTYLTKTGDLVMFLGNHRIYNHRCGYSHVHDKDLNVFVYLNGKEYPNQIAGLERYLLFRDFKKISEVVDKSPDIGYSDELSKLLSTQFTSKLVKFTHKPNKDDQYFWRRPIVWNGELYKAEVRIKHEMFYRDVPNSKSINFVEKYTIKNGTVEMLRVQGELKKVKSERDILEYCVDIFGICENGAKVKLT